MYYVRLSPGKYQKLEVSTELVDTHLSRRYIPHTREKLIAAVNALALISISTGLDSPAFRVVATGITLFLVISWLVLAPLTIWNLRTMLKIPKNNKAPQNGHEA